MPAFRFFDPWAAREDNQDTTPASAKVANSARLEFAAPSALARLAGLAEALGDPGSPAEPMGAHERAAAIWGEAEEERAAIVQFEGGVPCKWSEGFARLHLNGPPADVSARRWCQFIDDVGHFLDSRLCAVAANLGWGPYDLFGCDRDRPFARIDSAGLLWQLNGNRLLMLAADVAIIEVGRGARQTWRREPAEAGRVLAWELTP